MTFRINKSILVFAGIDPDKFGADVALFSNELKQHRAHMAIVEQEKALPELVEPNYNNFRQHGDKALGLFDEAVKGWHDEKSKRHQAYPAPHIPSPFSDALDEDGNPCFEIVDDSAKVAELKCADRKEKLAGEVTQIENDLISKIIPPGKRRAFALLESKIHSIDEKDRSPDDATFIAEQAAAWSKIEKINQWAADLHSNIEDLTVDNVDGFEIPAFEG